jgi:tetratricopeptide (TPR) repeat protein
MLRVIREQEPTKPSTKLSSAEGLPTLAANRGTEPARLTKLVRGELDWIVMKAIEKDRDRRYETANGFAMDVQRYLADEPVQACPPSATYRLRKFARRNKGGLAVAALVLFFLALLGSGVGWVVRDRSAREAGLRVAVKAALEKETDLRQRGRWGEARAVLEQVRQSLGLSGPKDLRRQVERAQADLALVDRLEAARLKASVVAAQDFDAPAAVEEYAAAFREAGIGEETERAADVADRIRSSAVRAQLVAALDDWALCVDRVEPARRTWLLAVARAADPGPWRDRFRDAAVWDDRAALERLAREAKVNELSPQILSVLGTRLRNHGADEMPLLIAAQRRYPSDFWLNFNSGLALQSARRWEEAIGYFRAAIALRPTASAVYHNLADALRDKGRADLALAEDRRATEVNPKDVAAHNYFGWALRDNGRLDEAIAEHRKAIELNPKDVGAHHHLGLDLWLEGRGDEALAEYRKSIALNPRYVFAHVYLGMALRDLGREELAIAELTKAVELEPMYGGAHYELGIALRYAGRVEEAIAELKKADQLEPNFAWPRYQLGLALRDLGRVDEAIAAFEERVRHHPDWSEAHFGLATALAAAKQWDRSASVYAAAVKRFGADLWPRPWSEAIRSDEVFARLTARESDDRLPRIMRARLHVFERDWKRAGADYARLYESLAGIDGTQLLPEGGDDLIVSGCVSLLLGDRAGYEQLCKKWADRVGNSPAWGFFLARAWGVSPRPVVPAQQIVLLAEKAVQAERAPWIVHALSLAHYRNGEFDRAIELALESNRGSWGATAKALNWVILAMAHSRLGHAMEARQYLGQARELVDRASPFQLPGVKWPDMAVTDFAEFELLRREAEDLINPKSKEKPERESG